MKTRTFWIAFLAAIAVQLSATAQTFDNFYNVTSPQYYFAEQYTKNVVDLPNEGEGIITVGLIADAVFMPGDGSITRIDPAGNVVWSNRYGPAATGEQLNAVIVADEGTSVIAVGVSAVSGVNSALWAIKVDVATGAVIWSNTYGTAFSNEIGNAIIETVDGTGDFIIVGTAINNIFQFQLYGLRINNATGAQVWANLYLPTDFPAAEIVPRNITYHPEQDAYMMIGDYDDFGQNPAVNDVFTFPINGDGSAANSLIYYQEENVITSGNDIQFISNGNYITTYTWNDLFSNEYFAIMEIDPNQNPVWSRRYFLFDDIVLNHAVGVYENTESDRFDLFTEHQNTSGLRARGFLGVDPVGNPVLSRIYTPIEWSGSRSMALGNDGYLSKGDFDFIGAGLPNTFGYSMLSTDLDGNDPPVNCNFEFPFQEEEINPEPNEVKLDPLEYGTDLVLQVEPLEINGDYYRCDFVFAGSYKHNMLDVFFGEEVAADQSDYSVYPNPVGSQENLSLQINTDQGKSVVVQVHNALGQQLVKKQLQVQQGTNSYLLDAEGLSSGLNFLRVSDEHGTVLFETKVIVE